MLLNVFFRRLSGFLKEFVHSYKNTQSKELDNHKELLKWRDISKSKSEDFSGKSQIKTHPKENLKSLNNADDIDTTLSQEVYQSSNKF